MTRPGQPSPPSKCQFLLESSQRARHPGSLAGLWEKRALEPDSRPRPSLNGFLFSAPEKSSKAEGKGLQPPLPAKVNREGHSRLPGGLLGRLKSLTELSDSLKNMLRGPDFMTKFIYPGSGKTPKGRFFPLSPIRGMKPSVCQASEVLY